MGIDLHNQCDALKVGILFESTTNNPVILGKDLGGTAWSSTLVIYALCMCLDCLCIQTMLFCSRRSTEDRWLC